MLVPSCLVGITSTLSCHPQPCSGHLDEMDVGCSRIIGSKALRWEWKKSKRFDPVLKYFTPGSRSNTPRAAAACSLGFYGAG